MSSAKVIGFYGVALEGKRHRLYWLERGAVKRDTKLDVTVSTKRETIALLERLNCSGAIQPPSAHGYATV